MPPLDAQQRQDWRIAERVATRLARSRSLDGSSIRVGSRLRVVTLDGFVGSEAARERALQLARRTPGVRRVEDRLEADPDAALSRRRAGVGDEVLAERIARTLAKEVFPEARVGEKWLFGWELEGDNWELRIDVDQGFVTLEGEVDSLEDLKRAIDRTRALEGVRGVSSEVEETGEWEGLTEREERYRRVWTPQLD